jgi:hypothetical protein
VTRIVRGFRSRVAVGFVVAAAATAGLCLPAPVGAVPLPPVDITFDGGQVCTFELRVVGTGGDQVVKELPSLDGDGVTISAGRGYNLVFTNVENGRWLELPSRFSSTTTFTHPDGSKTVYLLGWNVLFLFPSDVPAGPSTTLHVGLLVYEDDGNANFVVDQERTRSKTSDICAALI